MSDVDEPLILDPEPYLPLIDRALAEDHAREDVTATTLLAEGREVSADILAKENGIVCGITLVEPVFQRLDPTCRVETEYEDGDTIGSGSVLLTVHGPARAVLSGERIALNLLSHLCGIATLTAEYVEGTMATGARIYDTRKTTPGWRDLEKYAVRCGGGHNHRQHLADAAMIKENHLKAAYGTTGPEAIEKAVRTLRDELPDGVDLYCEVESQAELEAAIRAGATVVMLDDFDIAGIRQAVRTIHAMDPPRPQLEITGGVRLDTVEALSSTGAQRLSVGRLTHSARALDLSMQVRRDDPA